MLNTFASNLEESSEIEIYLIDNANQYQMQTYNCAIVHIGSRPGFRAEGHSSSYTIKAAYPHGLTTMVQSKLQS